jgi:fructokinase
MIEEHPRTVVGIGELLWDCFPDRRRPGGAPANVAFHAAQLGQRGLICSRIGDDDLGRALRDELHAHGLSTELIQLDERLPTGRVTVDTSDPASPSYVIHRDVAWDAIDFDASVEAVVRGAAAVCVGTLAQRSEVSRETILRCLEAAGEALRVYDVNLRPDGYRREWIEETLRRVHVVKLNDEEVTVLAPMLGAASEPEAFGRELIGSYGVELVCVTRAAAGCSMFTDAETVHAPGKRVTVADSVGAGDAFTAALITARLREWPLARTARLANDVGALVASRRGAMPDVKRECAELLAGNPAGAGS